MTNAEVERLKAQMNMENIDMSGAQAESQEDQAARVKRELPLFAQAMTQIAHAIADQLDGVEPVKIVIGVEQPKKKWWQWWKK